MSVAVELTYDMSKALGLRRFEVEDAGTVRDVLRIARDRFGEQGEAFDKLTRLTAIAVNGVLVNHQRGIRTRLSDGDTVAFLKPAAGG